MPNNVVQIDGLVNILRPFVTIERESSCLRNNWTLCVLFVLQDLESRCSK